MTKSILIDKRWAGDTGIGRLYKEIMERMPAQVNASFIQQQTALGSPFSPFLLAKEIARSSPNLFYSPSFMPPSYTPVPFVITIHDLMHLYYYSSFHRFYFKQIIARLAKKAKQIITVSHYSKTALIQELGIPGEKISVIYNGIDAAFLSNKEHYPLKQPYFLYIGNRRKNKNIPAMVEAFAHARIPKEILLVLNGHSDPLLQALIDKHQLKERVRFLGFIEEADLPKLYKGAFATLYVSLMEGFGLPILESMASGTPVITSNTTALPEIAGGAALCVNPEKIEAISEAIEQLYHHPALYQQFVAQGYSRIKDFSWETTAKQTWEILLS